MTKATYDALFSEFVTYAKQKQQEFTDSHNEWKNRFFKHLDQQKERILQEIKDSFISEYCGMKSPMYYTKLDVNFLVNDRAITEEECSKWLNEWWKQFSDYTDYAKIREDGHVSFNFSQFERFYYRDGKPLTEFEGELMFAARQYKNSVCESLYCTAMETVINILKDKISEMSRMSESVECCQRILVEKLPLYSEDIYKTVGNEIVEKLEQEPFCSKVNLNIVSDISEGGTLCFVVHLQL